MDKLHLLTTDWLLWLLVVFALAYSLWAKRQYLHQKAWQQVFSQPIVVIATVSIVVFIIIALADSVHWLAFSNTIYQNSQIYSLIDQLFNGYIKSEVTYSLPFASHLFNHSTSLANHLQHINPIQSSFAWFALILKGIVISCFLSMFCFLLTTISLKNLNNLKNQLAMMWQHNVVRAKFFAILFWFCIIVFCCLLIPHYHLFGTDQVGHDVFFQCIKSIRTGLIIGGVTTLFMLPFAITLGLFAGFFGGFIDDIIQTIYTTLSSIPAVLLISAAVLSLQIFMSSHADLFAFMSDRADLKLLGLCLILGITGWTPLARLLRAESLKLKQTAYIDAAKLMGTSNLKIISTHLLPNVMHLVLMTVILDFSGLVLAEAVLSYVGVGVDPSTYSWGNIINASRLELAREPVIWWPLVAAFISMFIFVLSANILADAVRNAFNPSNAQ